MSGSGFRGPECLSCGGIRSEVTQSGWTMDDQRIRQRKCLDCGNVAVSVEVYIEGDTSYLRLDANRRAMQRESDYHRRGKGIYRLPNRITLPDRLGVAVTVMKGGKVPTIQCRRGHLLTPENVYITPGSGSRDCITCRRIRQEARRIA